MDNEDKKPEASTELGGRVDSVVMRFDGREYVTDDELVSVYCCSDKSWRVAYYPFSDKDRNLTEKQALDLVPRRYEEALKALGV